MEDYYFEKYDTKVTPLDLEYGKEDEFGVVYSLDGKRLLKCNQHEMKYYEVHPNTEIICDEAFYELLAIGCCQYPGLNLSEIKLPNSIKVIGNNAFKGSTLHTINLPDGLLYVGSYAFYNTRINQIKLPNSLRYIGDFAFGLIFDLKEICIPAGVTSLGQAPFCNCYDLEKIDIAGDSSCFTIYEGILYNHDKTRLIQCPSKKTENFVIPETAINCDRGAFCSNTNTEEIPEVAKMRWHLHRMKEIWLELVDRPCGIRTFTFPEIGKVISIKLSNSIYCNIKCSYDKDGNFSYQIDSKNDFITLMNALSVDKSDIARALGMIDEVKPRRNKYKCYLNRELAKDISVDWFEDFLDEETGKPVTLARNEILASEGDFLDQWGMEKFFSEERLKKPFPILLYKDSSDCLVNCQAYYYIKDSKNHPQEEALYLLDKEISHLRFLYFQAHKNYLLHAFAQSVLSPSFEEKMVQEPLSVVGKPSRYLDWKDILNNFFDKEIEKLNPEKFSYNNVFHDFTKNWHTLKAWSKDFAKSFSFLFADVHDSFADGPFL